MKTFTIFLFAFVFAFVVQSCWGGGDKIHVLEIESIRLDNMIHYKRDSFSYYQTVFDSDVIRQNDSTRACFELSFLDTVVSTYFTKVAKPIGQMAIADETTYLMELESDIKELTITTVYDFDNKHKAGSDLREYFSIQKYEDYRLTQEEVSLATVEADLNQQLNGFYYNYNINVTPILFLNTKPTKSDTVSVVVKIKFEDGTMVQARTEDVIIR